MENGNESVQSFECLFEEQANAVMSRVYFVIYFRFLYDAFICIVRIYGEY